MGLLGSKKKLERQLPIHLGIIMDGNGRWASSRGLPRSVGHKYGAENFREITKYCSKIGIKYLTVYAFSTENWKRPDEEVDFLMKLFGQYLREALEDFQHENIKVLFMGEKEAFSPGLRELIEQVEHASSDCVGMVLNIAMNYGGRDEIIRAVKGLAGLVRNNALEPQDIDADQISRSLYTAGQPDPDLIIRPSGEHRVSNFMLWQAAYAEYVFMNVLWPDFRPADLEKAFAEFSLRNRRFGGV